jgi:hypothetical protein
MVLVGGAVKSNLSWFALITFCAGAAVVVSLGIFFASATVASAVAHTVSPPVNDAPDANSEAANEPRQEAPAASVESFTGLVTDDHCRARHDMGSDKSPSECAKVCVRNGAAYVLVDGDKAYNLEGNTEEIGRVSGRRVTLFGSLEGSTIQVSSIADNQ